VKSFSPEVLRGLLTAYAVVALEAVARITIHAEQRVVGRLIQQATALNPRDRTLLIRGDVDHSNGVPLSIKALSSGADS
jgi:hypothetical protein